MGAHDDRRQREQEMLKQGDRVRDARKSVGFDDQLPFAIALGVDRQSVSNWERGRQRITPERASQIEHLCNADAGYILTGEGYLHGGEPRVTPLSANEMSLLQRVADLERELAALREALLLLAGDRTATPDDIQTAIDSGRRVAEQAGAAARAEAHRRA